MRARLLVPAALGAIALLSLSFYARPRAAGAQEAVAESTVVAESADANDVATFGDETAGPDEVTGEIAVDLRDDDSPADIAALDSQYGVDLRANSTWGETNDKIDVADVDPARVESLALALAHDPRVERAEPMGIYRATFVPDDPLYASKQWHIKRVGAETAWEYSCGAGVTVAVIDTGVACFDKGPFTRGTDLTGTRCEGGYNFVDNTREGYDDHGHGTHVAGTIAQTTNNGMGTAGLAYCATLMPVKVLNKQGFGTSAGVAEGIRFAADNGAQVINMSLGGPVKSRIIEDAVNHALAKGVVVVAAAGNSGRSVGYPAAYPGVIAVSATDSNDKIASFSSRGPEVVLAAPGVAVTQQTICNGGRDKCEIFGTFNGTSMASPHVAGVAAMIEGLGVTDADAVRGALTSSARDKGDAKLYGAGIVDGGAAASHVFWGHFIARAIALAAVVFLVARRIRKRGGKMARSPGAVLGALVASVGLLSFAPLLGLGAHAGKLRWLMDLAMRPLGEWDAVLLGAGFHKWLLFASALPAIGLAAIGFASKRLRPIVGGVAVGSAALCAQMAWSGDAAFVGGSLLARVWAVGNALVCLWLARMALEKSK
jgi:serine protease